MRTPTTALAVCATALFAGAATAQSIDAEAPTFEGDTVTFASVTALADGWLVIHETDQNGTPLTPQSVGHVAVTEGENMDVTVTVEGLTEGSTYVAMLHDETNDNDTYDFGESSIEFDTPVMVDDEPVVAPFSVTTADPAADTAEPEADAAEDDADAAMEDEPAEDEPAEDAEGSDG